MDPTVVTWSRSLRVVEAVLENVQLGAVPPVAGYVVSVSTPVEPSNEITCFSGVRLAAEPNLLTNEMLESVLPARIGVTFSATQLERSLVSISSIVVRARWVASTFANTRCALAQGDVLEGEQAERDHGAGQQHDEQLDQRDAVLARSGRGGRARGRPSAEPRRRGGGDRDRARVRGREARVGPPGERDLAEVARPSCCRYARFWNW